MDLTSDQQIFEQVRKSNKILIVLPENLTADSLSAGLALRLFLSRLQKDVVVATSGRVPENLKFLPGVNLVQNEIGMGKSLVITVDTSVKKMEEVSYQTGADKVQIYLKSKDVQFDQNDLSFSQEKFPVDLIVCLGAKSLEDLGALYEQRADLFFETPKINIDNKTNNEYFGQLNFVDVTATSVSEILAEVLQKYEEQLVDEDIATCLLSGIIAQTNSFQHVQTTPKAFLKASELVSLGGRQQEIIKNIFKTKSLSLLKLWGRALARIKTPSADAVYPGTFQNAPQSSVEVNGVKSLPVKSNTQPEGAWIYSVLNLGDFEKAESSPEELPAVLKEFIDNAGSYKIVALIFEVAKDSTKFLAAVHEQIPAENFLENLGNNGKILDFKIGNYRIVEAVFPETSLEGLESKFLETVKS